MRALLISTYELGHQPFGLASPAAWLRAAEIETDCLDLSRAALTENLVLAANLIAFYLPMHTATRLAVPLIDAVRDANPAAHLCCYGLYAAMNAEYLRAKGVTTILSGEFESGLCDIALRLQAEAEAYPAQSARSSPLAAIPIVAQSCESSPAFSAKALPRRATAISLSRQKFVQPDRRGLPPLAKYARLMRPDGSQGIVGYTEASRGCKHLCRHCPVVPVYHGVFRIVQPEVVLQDVRQQVEAGAEHITFGDPDFFNGTGHALPLVRELHGRFPELTYDVTIKIEHLLRYSEHLSLLRNTGCLFVTSAVESVDDDVLARLAKGHTRADFIRVAADFREAGLTLHPTFVAFTPWTTLAGYLDLLDVIESEDLVPNTAPIQLGIRLLIPLGSLLLDLPEMAQFIEAFDEQALVYPWANPDPRVDSLASEVQQIVQRGEKAGLSRANIFAQIHTAARVAAGLAAETCAAHLSRPDSSSIAIPYINEPWYCCAEPAGDQLVPLATISRAPRQAQDFV
jgi:fumarate reductase subunit D